MPALNETERLSLAQGLTLLEGHLPAEQAKTRLRQAFIRKEFSQDPLFALPYDEAEIDWTTGSVKIPRKKDRFIPTFLRSDFDRHFFGDRMNDDEISEAARQARFAKWEKLGLDVVKHDLLNGGYRVVGGPPQVQELGWEWVRMEERQAEQSVAKTADVLTLKPGLWGINVDLKEIGRRVAKWWRDRKP